MADARLQLLIEARNKAKGPIKDLKGDIQGVEKELNDVQREANQTNVSFAQMGRSSGLGALRGKLLAVTGVIAGVTAAVASLRAGIGLIGAASREASSIEDLTVEFEVLLGSAEAAKQRIDELDDFAARTPFQLDEVAEASKTLETLTRGALSTGDGLTIVGDVAAATGQPFQELSVQVGRLYDGLQSGRPVGEPLMRLQELGIVSGDTRAQIEALQKEGRRGDVVWSVAAQAFERFAGTMEARNATFSGQLSNLQQRWRALLRTFGTPINDAWIPVLTQAADSIKQITLSIDGAALGQSLQPFIQGIGNLVLNLIQLFGWVVQNAGVLWDLAQAFIAGAAAIAGILIIQSLPAMFAALAAAATATGAAIAAVGLPVIALGLAITALVLVLKNSGLSVTQWGKTIQALFGLYFNKVLGQAKVTWTQFSFLVTEGLASALRAIQNFMLKAAEIWNRLNPFDKLDFDTSGLETAITQSMENSREKAEEARLEIEKINEETDKNVQKWADVGNEIFKAAEEAKRLKNNSAGANPAGANSAGGAPAAPIGSPVVAGGTFGSTGIGGGAGAANGFAQVPGQISATNQQLSQTQQLVNGGFSTAINGAANAVQGLMQGTTTFGQAASQIFQSLINYVIQWIAQQAIMMVTGQAGQTAMAATSAATNAKVAATAAPAAAAQAAASWGTSAVIGAALLAGAVGLMIGLFAGGGFALGGLIGGTPSQRDNRIAAVATGEYVARTSAVQYYGADVFNALNSMRIPRDQAMAMLGGYRAPVSRGTTAFSTGGEVMPVSIPASGAIGGDQNVVLQVAMVNSRQQFREFQQKEGKKYVFDSVSKRTRELGGRRV